MVALTRPTDDEIYLLALLDSPNGIDLAEFQFIDPGKEDRRYRLHPHQWSWWADESKLQIDQSARACGKSEGIKLRAGSMPFHHEGASMLLTAPELNHLRPVTDVVERMILENRVLREMLPSGKGSGIARQPHWQCRFKNGTQLISRLPNRDGRAVKGMHCRVIEQDEAQDYPAAGWVEIVETLNSEEPGATWRIHGVSRGVRDSFFEKSQPGSGFKVHRITAMHRPGWNEQERNARIAEYGGSRNSVDYKRNILGEHGDASSSVFVLSRLMNCIDVNELSVYNTEVYTKIAISYEKFPVGATVDERLALIDSWITVPQSHFDGYSMKTAGNERGAPKGYSGYWLGMDVGVTRDPSEVMVFGQRHGTDFLELLLRVNLQRVHTDDQKAVIRKIFQIYGSTLIMGLDKTGVGFPLWDQLTRESFGDRVYGFGFSEKRIVGLEERELKAGETIESLSRGGDEVSLVNGSQVRIVRRRNVVEASTDWLRNDYVDAKNFRLPYDREVLQEYQGQSYCCDTETEILTKRGWLRYDQVQPGDETLGIESEFGSPVSSWTPIMGVNSFDISNGQMASMVGQCHNSLTTLNHRWLVKPFSTARYHEWRTSAELFGDYRFRIPLDGWRSDHNVSAKYQDDFVELVAWYYTEGQLIPGNKVGFSQSEVANPDNVKRIEEMLFRMLGDGHCDIGRGKRGTGRWSKTSGKANGNSVHSYRILDKELNARVLEVVVGPEKIVTAEFLSALTKTQLELFVNVSLLADGCEFTRERIGRQTTHVRTFIQKDLGRVGSFEMACALLGWATHRKKCTRGMWEVSLLSRSNVHTTSLERRVVQFSGRVWCPTTGMGTWLARRGGAIFFTGNSVQRDSGDPYGQKRVFTGGSFHSLDASKMMIAAKHIPPLEAMLNVKPKKKPVLDVFMGM